MASPLPRSLALIEKMIGFDTTSRLSNLALIDFVADYLRGHGIASRKVFDASGKKANLYASIGPDAPGGIVLSGHTDVVPVDGQDWASPPFTATARGSHIYGRGTADMKSFIAIVLALVPEMTARPLRVPLHFAFSYDEEVGCLGVHGLLDLLKSGVPRPRAVIVGEPTMMRVVNAHKGINTFRTVVTGLEAHSSATHQGVNAIQYAAEIIAFLTRLSDEMKAKGGFPRFDPPHTTVHVGTIQGGTVLNIIPRECRFVWEFRGVPGQDEQEIPARLDAFVQREILPRMQAVSRGTGVRTTPLARVAPLLPTDGSPAETLVMALAETNETHTVAYGTEAGFFQEIGIPAVICGPGDIAQAHRPDEFIALDQVAACETFLRRLIDHAAR